MAVVALVDFGNTLVDETFMWRDQDDFPDWTRHYGPVVAELASDWDRGVVRTADLIARVADEMGRPIPDVERYVDELCRSGTFYPGINRTLASLA